MRALEPVGAECKAIIGSQLYRMTDQSLISNPHAYTQSTPNLTIIHNIHTYIDLKLKENHFYHYQPCTQEQRKKLNKSSMYFYPFSLRLCLAEIMVENIYIALTPPL